MKLSCIVYRGKRNRDTYLFVGEVDGLARVPVALLQQLGGVELTLQLELCAGRRLARASATEVMRKIEDQGFYLQVPPLPDAVILPGAVPKC